MKGKGERGGKVWGERDREGEGRRGRGRRGARGGGREGQKGQARGCRVKGKDERWGEDEGEGKVMMQVKVKGPHLMHFKARRKGKALSCTYNEWHPDAFGCTKKTWLYVCASIKHVHI